MQPTPTNLPKIQQTERALSLWNFWGAVSLAFFAAQCITGVMMLTLRQSPVLLTRVDSFHVWASYLLLASIALHLVTVYLLKLLHQPREYGIFSGMALFVLAIIFFSSGYLLPMDELMYFGGGILRQIFALHVLVLPAVTLPLLAAHLWVLRHEANLPVTLHHTAAARN